MNFKLTIFICAFLFLACERDDTNDDTPIDNSSLVGEWLLTESYVSPGGVTDWIDVKEGYRYFFDEFGGYKRTDFDENLL